MDGHYNMKKNTILEIYKEGTDICLRVPKNTSGRDIEIGLANAIKMISDHQREIDPDFKTETLVEAIKGWIKCLD